VLEKAGLNSQWYVLEQLDLNHDGKITWDEFKTSLENAPASEKRPEALESLAVPLADSQDWPLRWKALRVFAMADKQMLLLDTKQLAGDGSDSTFAEMLRSVLGGDGAGLVSQAEWLEIVKKFALEDEVQAASFLDLCLKRLGEQKEHWKLREEALQVFSMGDRNGDGHLDMNELTELRQNTEFAQAMLDVMDIDKNGIVSKGEWLAYVKRLADQNETSTAAVLKLYGQHLSSKTPVVGEAAIDVIPGHREDGRALEDSGVRATQRQRRWACC
jgi:Ca2+-binding EF-hand superfamily protein